MGSYLKCIAIACYYEIMNEKIDWGFLVSDSRARVYLLWAVLTVVGFTTTHFFQRREINGLWLLIAIIGLGYMYKVMPLRVKQMKHIYVAWLVPITVGLVVSSLAFRVETLASLTGYLGAYWLVVLAVGYGLNGLVDPPSEWYWFAVGLNALAALLCFYIEPFTVGQYLIAAIVSGWSMLNLWLFRT